MTSFAIGTIPTVMFVPVTGDTTRRKPLVLPIPVTGFARHIAMFPHQRKRSNVVIEACVAPTIGAVAGSAIRSKAPTMIVVICVAGVAICRRPLVNTVAMAGVAIQFTVSACQREACVDRQTQ